MRLRLMAMASCSFRYAASRSRVQDAKGRPKALGSVRAVAITAALCSGV
jgi:hypothetical protein